MGKLRMYDEDVHEVFGIFGVEVAILFEAIRYKQQLNKGKFFSFKSKEIAQKCDLSYKQQLRARKILETTGWIETQRGAADNNCLHFRVTEFAEDIVKYTPRKRNLRVLHRKLVNKKI